MTKSWPEHNRFLTFTKNWIITFGWNGLKRRTKLSSKLLSSMENLRERLSLSGISGTAYSLIANPRRSSSTVNYESAWRKWVGWCRSRQIDSVSYDVTPILDFLGEPFYVGYKYRIGYRYRYSIGLQSQHIIKRLMVRV